MTASDRYLIVAQKSDYTATDNNFKIHFRSTLEGAQGLASNILRKLGDGHEVCIFDLTLHEIVSSDKPQDKHSAEEATKAA